MLVSDKINPTVTTDPGMAVLFPSRRRRERLLLFPVLIHNPQPGGLTGFAASPNDLLAIRREHRVLVHCGPAITGQLRSVAARAVHDEDVERRDGRAARRSRRIGIGSP